jgi:hypothetical protein
MQSLMTVTELSSDGNSLDQIGSTLPILAKNTSPCLIENADLVNVAKSYLRKTGF